MKLFLTSNAYLTLDLIGPLLPAKPSRLKVAFIPTAADNYIEKPWVEADRAKLVSMGFVVTNYDIKGKKASDLRHDLADFQIIFVAGGNTFYLLNEVRKSCFDMVLKELLAKDVLYIGSSAGSVLASPTIEQVELLDHKEEVPDLIDYTGLGLYGRLILPHFGREKYRERQEKAVAKYGDQLLCLKDNQAVMIDGDKIEIVSA